MSIKLKRLSIKNFKCFSKQKTIDLSKLTILTGANSSGKSSILHAILGAIQSGEFPYKFSPNGKYVEMGDFKEVSNKHLSKDITIAFTFKHKDLKSEVNYETIWTHDKTNYLPELKKITVSNVFFQFTLRKNRKGYLLDFKYEHLKDPDYDKTSAEETRQRMMTHWLAQAKNFSKTNKVGYNKALENRKKYVQSVFNSVTITNHPIKDLESIHQELTKLNNANIDYTKDVLIDSIFEEYDNVINAISSFRHHPSRTYLEQSKDKLKVDKFGDGYLDQILLWEKTKHPKFKELQQIMKDDLSLLNSLKGNRTMGGGRYEVLVKTKENGIETSLFDVGFGINQFMPIIVADLQLSEGSTLFVAEPEIHLHPNVQALFGDYLVKQINNNKKNYVIETHSEYLLNRIRLAIVKKTLKEEDLSVYFLENNGDDVITHKLKFEKNGSISNAPDSFFDTYMMDLKNIAFNAE